MKVFLDSVGCRLNQSEIESYARQFQDAGHSLIHNLEDADLMVLNTCAVTSAAASDSRQKLRRGKRMGVPEIVVTGCWSEIEKEQAASFLGVSRVVPNKRKDFLVSDLLQIDTDIFDLEPISRDSSSNNRLRTRAFIKAQDGCENRCTFCVTTIARGASRSNSISKVIRNIHRVLDDGAKEIVLTGVHLGSWGHDFPERLHIKNLVSEILEIENIPRLRLSSLEPWDLDESFFELWDDPRLCRHLHLPLQSGSAKTLRRMARNTKPEKFSALISSARSMIPQVAITTDIIVGFPGETDQEFQDSLSFVNEMNFAGAHVFTYSERQGTAAASMPNSVPHSIRKERSKLMHGQIKESAMKYKQAFLGKQMDVLWESQNVSENEAVISTGLTDNYLRIETTTKQPLWNQIAPAKLIALTDNGLRGELMDSSENIWFQ